MSSSAAPSKKPHVCTLPGMALATASRLFIAPMAPALQPPNSSRVPCLDPSPWRCIRSCITAATMRLPRNSKPKVAALAPTSPLHRSEEQYLTYTRFAVPHGLLPSVAKMPPCAKSYDQGFLMLLM